MQALEGETFSDFYVRLKHIAEEIDVCPGSSSVCEETQLKMIILMGVRDEELTQKLISLDTTASLQDVVNACRSHEANKKATSAIRASSSRLCALSTYKKQKGRGKGGNSTPPYPQEPPCQSCARKHSSADKCPAADGTCNDCGRKGHWAQTPKCPAITVQCKYCSRMGHYDKCCKKKKKDAKQGNSSSSSAIPPFLVKPPVVVTWERLLLSASLCLSLLR